MTEQENEAGLSIADETFRTLGRRVIDMAADFLRDLEHMPAYPSDPAASLQDLDAAPPRIGMGEHALDALSAVITSSRPPTSRFFGYVSGSGEPVAALGDLLASVLNQNVTSWRSAPSGVAIEQQVISWIAQFIACGEFTGSLCGGGSASNLMALAMARESRLPANETGVQGGVVYASSEVHMSIPKAVALLGLGRANLRLVAVDGEYRLDVRVLEEVIRADVTAGLKPLAVVATAGTVNTGAIDPLLQVRAVCDRFDLWLHVDGAYGALAAAAAPEKFVGLSQADSISLDAHKWLYQPLDCGVLLFKDVATAIRTFSHSGDYVKPLETEAAAACSYFDQSVELSRRFRALKLWLSLRYHGLEAFRSAIGVDLRHAAELASRIATHPELELLAPVTLSAVCFRYRSTGSMMATNELNTAILKRVISRGRVYLSNATLRGMCALRACFVNHRTRDTDVALIVTEVLAAAAELSGGV